MIEPSKGFNLNWIVIQLFKQKDDSGYWIRSLHYLITLKKRFDHLKSYDKHTLTFELFRITLISASNVTPLNRDIVTENSLFFSVMIQKWRHTFLELYNVIQFHFISLSNTSNQYLVIIYKLYFPLLLFYVRYSLACIAILTVWFSKVMMISWFPCEGLVKHFLLHSTTTSTRK